MSRSNARPEEPGLFDLPLTAPPERRPEVPQPPAEGEPHSLDLFPGEPAYADEPGEEIDPTEAREELPEAAPAANSVRRRPPSLGDHVAADLLDLGAVLAALAAGWVGALVMGILPGPGAWPAFAALGLVFSFLYLTIPLAFWGHTPGMARRRLTTRAEDGGRITFRQAILRWAAWALTLGFAGLPYLVALSGGRPLTDRLSLSRTFLES